MFTGSIMDYRVIQIIDNQDVAKLFMIMLVAVSLLRLCEFPGQSPGDHVRFQVDSSHPPGSFNGTHIFADRGRFLLF